MKIKDLSKDGSKMQYHRIKAKDCTKDASNISRETDLSKRTEQSVEVKDL